MKIFLTTLALFFYVPTASASEYIARYDVYAGGIHALQARLNYAENSGKYEISVASETYGLLAKIIRWRASFKTTGNVKDGNYLPIEHISDTTSRSKHEVNHYKYDPAGKLKSFKQVVNGKDETQTDLDSKIMAGTIDVISATFNAMSQASLGKSCTSEDMIFDSERSYRLKFADKGRQNLAPSKYSNFKGEATTCAIQVTPEGGKWHKKPRGWLKIQEQAKKNGMMPTMWISDLSKSKDTPYFPARMMIKTDYGTFIAHLTSFEEKPAK